MATISFTEKQLRALDMFFIKGEAAVRKEGLEDELFDAKQKIHFRGVMYAGYY